MKARALVLTLGLFASGMVPLTASVAEAKGTADPVAAVAGIDADVQQAMRDLHVPGVAIGVIVDGKVILAKGYGVREIGKTAPVDADTLFAIASMTKSFTATTVAAMVDDGRVEFDKPVVDYLPWFRMYDPVATELVTPRDLLTHRSGLPRHDFLRVSTYLTREELVHRIRYLEPSATFRQKFQYSNLMYTVAGYLAGSVAGTTWEDLVKQRIFVPLEMNHSNASAVELQQSSNYAHPHDYGDGKITTIPVYDYQKFGVGPNGAVNSSVNDMLKYLAFHLSDGTVNGKQVISKRGMWELHHASTLVGLSPYGNEYALGWFVTYPGGHQMLEHGGSVNGFAADMAFLPDDKTGIVVLNNLNSSLPMVITEDLVHRLLNLKPQDYLGKAEADDAKSTAMEAAQKAEFAAARIPNTKPTLDIAAYIGTYFNPAYGAIRVEREGEDGLIVRFQAIDLSLKHYHYDTFSHDMELAQFHLGVSGKVTELLLPLEPRVKPLVFIKQEKK
jgi:CubicO group peptidase (beta-lactamase class C family)